MQVKEIGLPIQVGDIIDLPLDEFNVLLSRFRLSEEQLELCHDVRRRGRWRVQKQESRKRKQMETEMTGTRGRNIELGSNQGQMLQKKAKVASNLNTASSKQPYNFKNSMTKTDNSKENITVRKISVNGKITNTYRFKESDGKVQPDLNKFTNEHQFKPTKRTENIAVIPENKPRSLEEKQREHQFVGRVFKNPKSNVTATGPTKEKHCKNIKSTSPLSKSTTATLQGQSFLNARTNIQSDNLTKLQGRNLSNQVRSTNGVQLKKRGEVLLQTRPEFVNIQKNSDGGPSKKVQQQPGCKTVKNFSRHIPNPSPNVISSPRIIPQKIQKSKSTVGIKSMANKTSRGKNKTENVIRPPGKQLLEHNRPKKKQNNPHKMDQCDEDLLLKESVLAKKCLRKNVKGQTFVFM